ncbi:MAG TPA: addiction module protein [Planctomycetota bacterium]|nr:addiction module protein [Planctomycetota bacterium]
MDMALPLDKMSVEEKLLTLEQLWEDLARTPATVPSPTWHRDVLEAREKRFTEGRERSNPWEKAKEDIRFWKP